MSSRIFYVYFHRRSSPNLATYSRFRGLGAWRHAATMGRPSTARRFANLIELVPETASDLGGHRLGLGLLTQH